MRQIWTLSEEDARAAIEAVRDELVRRGKAAVIAVVDAHGETIALTRMDGVALSSVTVATSKAFTAARLKRPSSLIGRNVRHPDTGFDIGFYGDGRYVGFGGGVPVFRGDSVAGGIGVSGLSSEEDEELAGIGIKAILARIGSEGTAS